MISTIRSLQGCLSCQLLQDHEDVTRFVILEVWQGIEVHKAAAQNIPKAQLEQTMTLLAELPSGSYYNALKAPV
jgi:quinol monooxygenase YgiN